MDDQKPEMVVNDPTLFVTAGSLRARSNWFIRLRWLSVVGVFVAVIAAGQIAGLPLPIKSIIATAIITALSNVCYMLHNRRQAICLNSEIKVVKIQMVLDLFFLTVLVNLTGGIENPLYLVYIIHVIIASLLLKGKEIYQIAALAILLFTLETLGEYFGVLKHHHLLSASETIHEPYYMLMSLFAFWVVLITCAYIGASFMRHNRAIKDDLVQRQNELKMADKAKIDFFRFVTHEVKSPIITALSAVDLALDKNDGNEIVDNMLNRASRRLHQAIDIVKDLSDLTRGGMKSRGRKEKFDLAELTKKLLISRKEMLDSRNLTLEADIPSSPVLIKAVPDMVEKILVNLIDNGIRYNHDGKRIYVVLMDAGSKIVFSVQDEGIGIKPEDQGHIFEEFYRTPAAREASSLGTGLGLPIVKQFAEQMKAILKVESEPDVGSTFTITFRNK
jgi:signal transduction histidine kinase